MAIIRACTWGASIATPENPDNYNEILVLFAQAQDVLIRKEKSDLSLTAEGVHVSLSQEETAMFKPSKPSPRGTHIGPAAYMQIRVYKTDDDAPGSESWKIDVVDSLSDEILPANDDDYSPDTPEEENNE